MWHLPSAHPLLPLPPPCPPRTPPAGEGEDGRMKSAIGIGALLMDGLGDTIRVSLTEDPEFEINPCGRWVRVGHGVAGGMQGVCPGVVGGRALGREWAGGVDGAQCGCCMGWVGGYSTVPGLASSAGVSLTRVRCTQAGQPGQAS